MDERFHLFNAAQNVVSGDLSIINSFILPRGLSTVYAFKTTNKFLARVKFATRWFSRIRMASHAMKSIVESKLFNALRPELTFVLFRSDFSFEIMMELRDKIHELP